MLRRNRQRIRFGATAAAAVAALLALPGVASAAVTTDVSDEGVLTASSDAGDAITITCENDNVKVNGLDPDGVVACAAINAIEVQGGPYANAIDLTGVTDADFTFFIASPQISAGGGDDTILGSEHPDVINGDDGNDRVVGFRNEAGFVDQMIGDDGDDTLVWNPGDGDDVMRGNEGNDTIEVNGGNAGERFTLAPSVDGRLAFDRVDPAPFNLDIGTAEKLDLNAAGGDDSLNRDGGAAGIAPFAIDADGGEGNDLLIAGDAADLLTGGAGDDRLVAFRNPAGSRDVMAGGEGGDTLVWNNGDGSDTMDGEAGEDVIEVNGGNADEQFTVKPSATAGRVSFDRVDPGPFNLDIGSSEELQLVAVGGDDRITGSKGLAGLINTVLDGGDGNDRIRGTDSVDVLLGGEGNDRIRSRDRVEDRVECGGGIDFARVDELDVVRGCDLVIGGRLRVKAPAKVTVVGDVATLRLRCVATRRCQGAIQLRSRGKTLASGRYRMGRNKSKTVRLQLNRKGRRLRAKAPARGLRAELQIDARDASGNGWTTRSIVRLKR